MMKSSMKHTAPKSRNIQFPTRRLISKVSKAKGKHSRHAPRTRQLSPRTHYFFASDGIACRAQHRGQVKIYASFTFSVAPKQQGQERSIIYPRPEPSKSIRIISFTSRSGATAERKLSEKHKFFLPTPRALFSICQLAHTLPSVCFRVYASILQFRILVNPRNRSFGYFV